MGKAIPPISKTTFSQFTTFINDVIKRNESGSVIGLSEREQSYRINQLKISSPYKIVDLKNYLFDDPEDVKLSLPSSKQKVAYLLTNADCLLDEKRSFLAYFNQLVKKNNNLSLIFLFQHNITYPWTLKVTSPYQYLFQNIYFYPRYSTQDRNQFVIYLEHKFRVKLPPRLRNLILKECGTNLWLIKEAIRYFTKTKDATNLFSHQEMIFRLTVIFNELEDKEKQVLKKIARQETNFTDEDKSVIDYLNQTNYLSPRLEKFIKEKLAKETKLSLDQDKKILLNAIPVDPFFSKTERKALRYFLSQQHILVSREQLGSALWDDGDFSDWALDQFIRRLRNKFIKLGLGKDLIKTKKNQGFIFNQ